jgi:probable rRNA maturation factor
MIDFENRLHSDIDIAHLEKISSYLTPRSLELIITDDNDIQTINKTYRNIDKATDVLSFPMEIMPGIPLDLLPLGSIIISYDYVKNGADKFGHNNQNELSLLFIHGLLHLLGFDHEIDSGEMRQEERRIINEFDLPNSLIVRTQQ